MSASPSEDLREESNAESAGVARKKTIKLRRDTQNYERWNERFATKHGHFGPDGAPEEEPMNKDF